MIHLYYINNNKDMPCNVCVKHFFTGLDLKSKHCWKHKIGRSQTLIAFELPKAHHDIFSSDMFKNFV